MNPPELPDIAATRTFIRGTALLSLIVAGVSVLWSGLQCLIVWLAKPTDLLAVIQLMLPSGASLPPLVLWLVKHALMLSLLLLVLSLAFAIVSWGLFQYRHWGRIGFMMFLIVIAIANFALLPVFDHLIMGSMTSLFPADFLATPEGRELSSQIQSARWFMWITSGSTMLMIAAVHGWLAFKLQRPQVRALFS